MRISLIKNSKGSILIVMILFLSLFLILATTMIAIATESFGTSQREKRRQSAYYAAEAGIRHQTEYMRSRFETTIGLHTNSEAFFAAYNKQLLAPSLAFQKQGYDSVNTEIILATIPTTGNPRVYNFTSRATVENVTRVLSGSITIEWALLQPPPIFFDRALFASGLIDIAGNPTIIGGVGTNVATLRIANNLQIPEPRTTNMNFFMPSITLPENLPFIEKIEIDSEQSHTLNTSIAINELEIRGTLTVDTGNTDIIIKTNTLDISGNGQIITTGTGRLFMLVTEPIRFSGNVGINRIGTASLIMFITSNSIHISGNPDITAGIYAPLAHLDLTGNPEILGAIMVASATIRGNPAVMYSGIGSDGIFVHLGEIPGFIPVEHMFIAHPWQEP